MLEAANRLDWSALTVLEAQRTILLTKTDVASPVTTRHLAQLISDILATDANIRERLESWHAASGALLERLTHNP